MRTVVPTLMAVAALGLGGALPASGLSAGDTPPKGGTEVSNDYGATGVVSEWEQPGRNTPDRPGTPSTPGQNTNGGGSSAPTAAQIAERQRQEQERQAAINSCIGTLANALTVSIEEVTAMCNTSVPAVPATPGQPGQPGVTVDQVRQRAVDQITLSSPDLKASPCLADANACTGTVGVPVWLWVGEDALPSGSASATAGPFTINAAAKVSKVKWSLGDGQTTTCKGTGTAYDAATHGWSTPDCGFERGWKQSGTYTLSATYVWDISWSGDQTGSATQELTSTREVTVGELQSVASSTG